MPPLTTKGRRAEIKGGSPVCQMTSAGVESKIYRLSCDFNINFCKRSLYSLGIQDVFENDLPLALINVH